MTNPEHRVDHGAIIGIGHQNSSVDVCWQVGMNLLKRFYGLRAARPPSQVGIHQHQVEAPNRLHAHRSRALQGILSSLLEISNGVSAIDS